MVSGQRRVHRLYSKRQSQESCITCPANPPCTCGAGEVCIEVNRSCGNCGTQQCVVQSLATPSNPPTPAGISTGALAGAISGAGVLLILVILAAFFAVRRQRRARPPTLFEEKAEVPVPAAVVLQRPDPNAAPPPVSAFDTPSTASFSAGQTSAGFQASNTSSHGATHGHTPVSSSSYPIADPSRSNPNLISATFNPSIRQADADSMVLSSSRSQAAMPPLFPSMRAALGLPIDGGRGKSSLALPPQRNVRDSFNTTSTFSSEMSAAEPVMAQGAIRQVLGFTRAEVVRTPKHSMSSLHPSVHMKRLSGTLSNLAFSGSSRDNSRTRPPPIPSRLGKRTDRSELEPLRNPFSDSQATSSTMPSPETPESADSLTRLSPAPTSATFGDIGGSGSPMRNSWGNPSTEDIARPPSLGSHKGSVASAASSHRRLPSPPQTLLVPPPHDLPNIPVSAALSTARSPPAHGATAPSTLERQQLLAIDEARSSARATMTSVADSLLSSFPFVPPSPHGSARSHYSGSAPAQSSAGHGTFGEDADARFAPSAFKGAAVLDDTQPPLTPGGRQRASLDTVALSADLASHPLTYDCPVEGKSSRRTEQ